MKGKQAPRKPAFFVCRLKQHFGKVYWRRKRMEKIIKVELRLRSRRHYSSPCPSAVHLAECLKAHSLATGAALNCFAFQTLKTECCDPTSPANSLTVNMGSGGVRAENMPSISKKMNQTDEWDSFEKLAVLFGVCQRSDWFIWQEVMEDRGFHVSILDKRAKLGAIGGRFCAYFLLFWLQCSEVKKKKEEKKRKWWAVREKDRIGVKWGQKRDYKQKREKWANCWKEYWTWISLSLTHPANSMPQSNASLKDRDSTWEKSSLSSTKPGLINSQLAFVTFPSSDKATAEINYL